MGSEEPPLELVEVDNPLWTHAAIDHAVETAEAYGHAFTDEQIANQRAKVDNDTPDCRNINPNARCFEIKSGDEVVGEVVVVSGQPGAKGPEIDVAVYAGHRKQGYGEFAFRKTLTKLRDEGVRIVEVVVRDANPLGGDLQDKLKTFGFENAGPVTRGQLWRHEL